ncbi:lipopolysaccharide export system ATP-binding protein [Fervidobacterium changbaicum]|uniref:Lipopolysaccharide export system ATP-binding protein LptB n=2 Tax=Fervidobacterium TaxID=2422 RepID=A0AAI8CJM0_FERIS|nr:MULTISPECIES: LPS export ABC transporter ATP-binding protein [Fervidobacterium]AMW32188.1 LPS export ABC transporter ATP-binding protein [Fervidobacterium islandicum]QAV32480.1 LPS export ABC transporter ATP-binding protein [Fervidobacterium changbaicum]SDH58295.1 lipopolysaccharide export system ATP-binding protein [Fervidobacterium changbaicum]
MAETDKVFDQISCERIVKKFGRKLVLKEVNMYVNTGEVVGLLGPNGSGKTTLFNIILGVVVPTRGKVYFNGKNITNMPIHKRARLGITYLQQETSVFRDLNVEDNVRLVLEFQKLKRNEIKSIIDTTLTEFGIDSLRKQYAFSLSGGEKRRLELARMMSLKPKFVLLDEPFIGIDPKTVKEIQKVVLSLKERGIGVIITDHSVEALKPIVDRLYVIHKGEVLAEGDPDEVLSNELVKSVYLGEE